MLERELLQPTMTVQERIAYYGKPMSQIRAEAAAKP